MFIVSLLVIWPGCSAFQPWESQALLRRSRRCAQMRPLIRRLALAGAWFVVPAGFVVKSAR
jgi:hypothetical protein